MNTITFNTTQTPAIVLLLCGQLGFLNWIIFGDDFHVSKKDISFLYLPKVRNDDREVLMNIYDEFIGNLPKTHQTKLNAGKQIGSFNISSLWHITEKSDYIFSKYLKLSELQLDSLYTEVVRTAISVFKE